MKNRLEQYPESAVATSSDERNVASENSLLPEAVSRVPNLINTGLGKYPAVTLGAGLAIGAFIGWFIKRR